MSEIFEIEILNRNYTEWKTNTEIDNPFSQKLFHKDTFVVKKEIDDENKIQMIDSPTRNSKIIPGILILENNRTFGRTPNKKKLYYSCIPNQKNLPVFLIPYDISLGFQKNIKNKFVLFRFDHWNNDDKHPYGILTETIGDVDSLSHYYEYQLYVKRLHPSYYPISMSKYNKKINTLLKEKSFEKYIQEINENTEEYGFILNESNDRSNKEKTKIFTIDPSGCVDRDDALSITTTETPQIFKIQVYIANIWVWLQAFDLWELIPETNVSTIYLPDFNRNMLPTELSEKICSLDETHPCFTFVMEFEVDILKKTIQPVLNPEILSQRCVNISKNFDYESKSLLKYPSYNLLLQITRELNSEIKDSHELVAFWMMQMNQFIGKEMFMKKRGIFRITEGSGSGSELKEEKGKGKEKEKEEKKIDSEKFFQIWENSVSGKYIEYLNSSSSSSSSETYHHSILNISHYMHFTSPIRRKIDICNQLFWIQYLSLDIGTKAKIDNIKIDKINEDTKKIRKLQNECTLLYLLQESEIPITTIDGIVIQNMNNNKSLVYLPLYKCILSCKQKLELYANIKCSIFIFERENDYKKKIELSVCI